MLSLAQGVPPTPTYPWSLGPHSSLSEFSNTQPAPVTPLPSAFSSLPSGQTAPLLVHAAWPPASSPMATLPYLTSPLTLTNGQARPLWLHPCEFRQNISSEYPTSLPSFCITDSYSSFGSTVDLFLLQDRFSDSPRLRGTSLCFPTSLCVYPLWT